MHLTFLFSSLAVLGATALAHPQARAAQSENLDLKIKDLVIEKVQEGNTTISFYLYNPDPLSGANATCNGSWFSTTAGNPQEDYELCGNSTLTWSFAAYADINNFTLNVEDRFTDPAVGDPPYDRVTVFGAAIFNDTNLECETTDDGSCKTANGTVVSARIYATTA